jgi:hypothetical protein
MKSVRNASALTAAKADLLQALTLAQTAGPLVKNRTDSLLHFVEYDTADAGAYNEFMGNLSTIKASLSAPKNMVIDGGLNDINLHLGAFYSAPYFTRDLLPRYASEALFTDPTPGTFPDPTFGGILPQLTQGSLSAGLAGYPLNVPMLTGVVASQSTSASKITISWNPVEGATGYQVWRSTSSDFSTAQKIATVGSGNYADADVELESTYYYWIRGYNSYQTGTFNVSPIIGITRAQLAMPWLNLLLE